MELYVKRTETRTMGAEGVFLNLRNWRINRVVNAEDTWLIGRVQQGMASRSYSAGPIASSEVCLRSFARKIRAIIPEARLERAPGEGWSGG